MDLGCMIKICIIKQNYVLNIWSITFVNVWPIFSQALNYRLHFIHFNGWIIFTEFWTKRSVLWRPNTMHNPRILFWQITCIFIIHRHPIYANGNGPRLSKNQIIKIIFAIDSFRCTTRKRRKMRIKNTNDKQDLIESLFTH